jgi:hypothetical protein
MKNEITPWEWVTAQDATFDRKYGSAASPDSIERPGQWKIEKAVSDLPDCNADHDGYYAANRNPNFYLRMMGFDKHPDRCVHNKQRWTGKGWMCSECGREL